MNFNIGELCKIVKGNALCETAFSNANYPLSGSYIDVSGYEDVNVVIHLGTINASDTPTFDIKCADSLTGTLDVLDATNCSHEIANDDDGEFVQFHIKTSELPEDHHFLSCVVSDAASTSYGDIVFYLCGARSLPVTQSSTAGSTVAIHDLAG